MTNSPPPVLSTKHYTGIGRVIVRWARLESRMIEAIRALLRIPSSDAVIAFWHMNYFDKRDRISALTLLREPDGKQKKHLESLTSRMDDAYDLRNLVAHSIWSKGKRRSTISPFVVKARGGQIKIGGHNLKVDDFSAQRLMSEADKIERLEEDFRQFFVTHYGANFTSSTPRKKRKSGK